jgi:hypothetical protein
VTPSRIEPAAFRFEEQGVKYGVGRGKQKKVVKRRGERFNELIRKVNICNLQSASNTAEHTCSAVSPVLTNNVASYFISEFAFQLLNHINSRSFP